LFISVLSVTLWLVIFRVPRRNLVKTILTSACRVLVLGLVTTAVAHAADTEVPRKWGRATAHVLPKWTATEGEGYFSIIEGLNGRR
jgi:hypothetical protein